MTNQEKKKQAGQIKKADRKTFLDFAENFIYPFIKCNNSGRVIIHFGEVDMSLEMIYLVRRHEDMI